MRPTGPAKSGAGVQWRAVLRLCKPPRPHAHPPTTEPASHIPPLPCRKPLRLQAENFTLFIKNTVTFSKFNFSK